MGGGGLDGNVQAGDLSAEPLGADAQGVDLLQQLVLQIFVEGVGVGLVQGTEQGMLGQGGHLVEGAPDAHPKHHRRAGVGPGQPDGLHHEIFHALHPVGGL